MHAVQARWLAPWVLLAAASVALPARARPVGFGQARAWAEQAAPSVQVAARRVALSRTEVEVAGTWQNPTLGVQSATRTAHLGTSLSLPLPLFGQRGTAIDAARADVAVSAREALLARSEALFGVTLGWLALWEAQQRAQLLQRAASDAERTASIAAERFDAGLGPRVDVVRTRAGSARAQADLAAAQADVHAAALRLAVWLGREDGEPSAAGEPGYPSALPDLGALQRWQAQQHPALQRDRARVRAAEAHVRSEQRAAWPIVDAQVGVNQFDPSLPGGPDVIGGLSFELPLLNQRGGAIARARSERRLAEAEAVADGAELRAELRAAYHEAQGAAAQLAALRDQVVPALLEARQMSEESYRSGRMDLLRLLEAQRALIESQLAEAEAAAAFGRALAELERTTGRRLDARVADAR